jgi:hypothetical protein
MPVRCVDVHCDIPKQPDPTLSSPFYLSGEDKLRDPNIFGYTLCNYYGTMLSLPLVGFYDSWTVREHQN